MAEIRICSVCKRRIPDREIQEGLVSERNGKLVCQQCLGPAKKAPRDDSSLVLEHILKELKSINRAVTFEEASIWNILGAMVQCFALAALTFAYLKGGHWTADTMLLLAVLLQLMALTFFTLKR